jgi:hypothetical protein
MAKRKAGSSEEGLSVAPNRRSNRRKTSDEDELAVSKKTTASNRAQKTKKPLKSSKSNISKTETVKEEDTNPSQVTRFVSTVILTSRGFDSRPVVSLLSPLLRIT